MLYNRYISGAWPDDQPEPSLGKPEGPAEDQPVFADVTAPPPQPQEPPRKNPGGLKGLFGGNIKLPEFDADTVLLLVLVYFLVADDTENISDTLLIIGVLLLLGF